MIVNDQDLAHLASVLQTLSQSVRRAFLLSRVYGYTYAEIGQILSLSPRTVEKHVAKALGVCYAGLTDREKEDENKAKGKY